MVTGGIHELTSRLVEGSYPSYRNALPAEPQSTVAFGTKELAWRASYGTDTRMPVAPLFSTLRRSRVVNLNNTSGSARIPVGCTYEGGSERFGLNASYLTEILKAFDGDEITFELNGPGRVLAREEGVTFLIMPITCRIRSFKKHKAYS